MRLIDADALKEVMISTLEHIKRLPKMDGQERHIIAAIAALSEMINCAPTVDAVPLGVEMWEDRFNIQTRTWRTKDGETEAKSFIITRRKRKDSEQA